MARHNPGDYPSANVRTAPTPSEPNTPIAEPGVNYIPNSGIVPPPTLPEEESEPQPPQPQANSQCEPEQQTNHRENRIPSSTNDNNSNEKSEDTVKEEQAGKKNRRHRQY